MGKFKKGVRVRLTEEHDGGGPKVGALGTIFGKDEDGDRDVVWDGLEEGHDGLANDGSNNHWYVPKSKLELVEDEPAPSLPFTVGDRVRLTKENRGYGEVGDVGTVLTADAGDEDCYVEFDREIQDDRCWYASRDNLEKVVEEAWVPKVGDRVRLIEDNYGVPTWGKAGEEGTVRDVNALATDAWVEFDQSGRWHAQLSSMEPVAAEAQPAANVLQIEAGKFYRTRDGRKVGPMEFRAWNKEYPWASVTDNVCIWQADGTRYPAAHEPKTDLVAEWVDEPVVAVEDAAVAEATATPAERKFKVGDRVKVTDPDDADEGTVATRNSDGHMSIKWDQFDCAGPEWWSDHELELVTTQPANDNNLVVTITAKNESVADALRTIAAALNAA